MTPPTVRIGPPEKTPTSYVFRGRVDSGKTMLFGFRTSGWEIRHHEVWDSVYPLMLLSGFSGPYWNNVPEVRLVFGYPVLASVVEYYEEQARQALKLRLIVEADRYDATFDVEPGPAALAFSGGKDSRLVYGLLRERGVDFVSYHSKEWDKLAASDIPGLRVSSPIRGTLVDRIMPPLMSCPESLYVGHGIGEAYSSRPWHNAYDLGGWPRHVRLFELLSGLGIHSRIRAPLACLPYNITQKILCSRYPAIANRQCSTPPNIDHEKNLHVAMCKRYHGIPHKWHCSEPLFNRLVLKFLSAHARRKLSLNSGDWMTSVHMELRAMMWAMGEKGDKYFSPLLPKMEPGWKTDWIDHVHDHMVPDLDPWFLDVFHSYATPYTGKSPFSI